MKRMLLITFLLVFIVQIYGQNSKFVSADLLNIREGSDVSYGVVGKVKYGEKVLIISDTAGWSQIETKSGIRGYVSTKYLSSSCKVKNISDNDVGLRKSSNTDYTWLWAIFLVFISLKTIKYLHDRKCTECGNWNAMVSIGKELVDEKQSTIKKIEKVKNKKGEVIRTKEKFVPATIYIYNIHRKCKYCGYKDAIVHKKKQEN